MKNPLPLFSSLTALLLAGCHHSPAPHEAPAPLPPATVDVAAAEIGTNQAVETVVGTVRARTTALISAKISGRIKSLVTQIGRSVKAGETLAEIDAAEIEARLEQARAGLENARRERDRYRNLLAQKAVTQSEYDAIEARHRIAEAAVSEARTMLGYTTLVAPFAGVIARQWADLGDLAGPGKPLLELDSSGGLRFETDLPEALTARIRLGQGLSVSMDGIGSPLDASVAEIAPAANPLSRTVTVKLDLPNQSGLRAGQFGRLTVPIASGVNVRVPTSAVLRRGQLEIVFVAEEGVGRLRLVKTGKRFGDRIELLSGIDNGESVIIAGHEALRDGQPLVLQSTSSARP